jgi:UDP-glucose 4-epimerase
MRALVTGGCGFIGSHITDLLLDKGYEVVVIDNLSTGRIDNLEHQKDNSNLSIHIEDIVNTDKIIPLFEGVDYVFHIAALADIVPSIEQPMEYHQSNVDGTISVLEAAKKANVKRLLYAASQYPYAFTKNIGEQYVMHWNQIYGLPVTSVRFFNVYGPRSRTSGTYGAVFGVFLAQKLANKPYTIVGDGTQTRDFTYVTDIANACYTCINSENTIGEAMNIGSGNTYSVNRLVELLGGEVEYIPKRPGEPDCTFADTKKVEQLTGWKAQVSFEDGVAKMMEHIDYWKEAPVWDKSSINEATKGWFKYLK